MACGMRDDASFPTAIELAAEKRHLRAALNSLVASLCVGLYGCVCSGTLHRTRLGELHFLGDPGPPPTEICNQPHV